MGILDFLGKNKITMGLFKAAFKKMNDAQKEDFIMKALDKMASGKENLPDNPQVGMMIKQWKGMGEMQKKLLVRQIMPQMSKAIEEGEFDKMMGGM